MAEAEDEAGKQGGTVGCQQRKKVQDNREKTTGLLTQGKQIIWQRGNTRNRLIKRVSQVQMVSIQCWAATNWKKPNLDDWRGHMREGTAETVTK